MGLDRNIFRKRSKIKVPFAYPPVYLL